MKTSSCLGTSSCVLSVNWTQCPRRGAGPGRGRGDPGEGTSPWESAHGGARTLVTRRRGGPSGSAERTGEAQVRPGRVRRGRGARQARARVPAPLGTRPPIARACHQPGGRRPSASLVSLAAPASRSLSRRSSQLAAAPTFGPAPRRPSRWHLSGGARPRRQRAAGRPSAGDRAAPRVSGGPGTCEGSG